MERVMVRNGIIILALVSIISTSVWADSGSEMSLNEIAAPVTHPTSFEDPRPYTEIRPIYIYHKIDENFVTGGGAANVYALQLRYAVNDRLAIIATKDGYVDLNTESVLDDEEGFADISAGFKYAFYRDDAARKIITAGLRFEIPTGDKEVFQGQGDGTFNPFLSAAIGMGTVNFMLGTGFRLAVDDEDSSFYDLDLHLDTKVGWLHPLVELNVYHVIDGGSRLGIPDEGEDFFNFGASGASGKTLVAAAVGFRADLSDTISMGAAYQLPVSSGNGSDILDYRVTTDLIFRF